MAQIFDCVLAGGGLVGCVVASRLSQAGHTVALVEAGPEDYGEQIMSPVAAPHLHFTPYKWDWTSTPQPGFCKRIVAQFGGELLSGSSAVNYGLWTRGHSKDYDAWAQVSGDARWSYSNMLKYFNPDANGGNQFGFDMSTENWKDGKRQPAGKAYNLSAVKVFTNSVVAKINIDVSKKATGVTLARGEQISGTEVIVSCGTCKTPQLLMLSGIGRSEQLAPYRIQQIAYLLVGEG